MREEVAKAVDRFDGLMKFAGSENGAQWQTIRARLVEMEAENERLDAECHLARKLAAMRGWRAEQAEALLRECRQMLPDYCTALTDRITAHLSEHSRG